MKNKFTYYIIIYLIVTLLPLFICVDTELAQTLAIILTGVIICYYTWETQKLRKETQSQTDLQIQPLPVIIIEGIKYKLKNIGNGTAIRINIEDIELSDIKLSSDTPSIKYRMRFISDLQIVESNDPIELNFEILQNGIYIPNELAKWHDPKNTDKKFFIKMTFNDIRGKKYRIIETIEKKKLIDLKIESVN
jgi:hypothetical protein